ncbi:MAG: FtsX-like permease family protein, partial [Nitrososphaeria archaeon]
DLGVKEVQRFMESYVERYGISREALLILSAIIFFLSSASIVMASKNLIRQHSGEVQVLRSIGASQKALKMDLLAKLLLWSLASSAAGLFLAAAILWLAGGVGCLQILSHNIVFQLDPLTLALNFILVSTLIIISVLGSELK